MKKYMIKLEKQDLTEKCKRAAHIQVFFKFFYSRKAEHTKQTNKEEKIIKDFMNRMTKENRALEYLKKNNSADYGSDIRPVWIKYEECGQ